MNKLIIKHYGQHEPTFRLTNSITSRVYHMYNLLMYPFPGFHGLYKKIQELCEVQSNNWLGRRNYTQRRPFSPRQCTCDTSDWG